MKKIIFFATLATLAFVYIPQPYNIAGCLVVAAAGIASIGL